MQQFHILCGNCLGVALRSKFTVLTCHDLTLSTFLGEIYLQLLRAVAQNPLLFVIFKENILDFAIPVISRPYMRPKIVYVNV